MARVWAMALVAAVACAACNQGTFLKGAFQFSPSEVFAIQSAGPDGGQPGTVVVGFVDVVTVIDCAAGAPVGLPARTFTFTAIDVGGISAATYPITAVSSNAFADGGTEVLATYGSGTATFTSVTSTLIAGTFSASGTAADGGAATMSGAFSTATICAQ